ncbi:hypothetical protein B0T25DRAFT_582714 [Lasiosphaeria hispida]|uniref:GPI inositol-deacylase n=1 Tax=Lasiosphaeria hispida TaxID=260671 RepID=A0AAJ0HFY2_9PEZI|nr:hypothetical protein B0T25DRAFT_582714 [Lasiosphaeria hispida]
MDQIPISRRTTSFAGFLSRAGARKELTRTDTETRPSSISLPATSLGVSDDDKGPLGLETLYEPQPPTNVAADLVFIHGLGGGSRKTWSFSSDPAHFWPRAWLADDNDFAGSVRIHAFGYRADWGGRQSMLNIHDFAQSLLGELQNHQSIRRTSTRIILVGHSMGGCVAKKVYILARQNSAAADIAKRIHSLFFLGTPHRGSDLAAVLENMLVVACGKKPFVADLTPHSAALSAINDAFRHVAPDLRLWSFYETLPVRGRAGIMNKIVVEKHSATLGYHNEECAAMDADHRHVCKFDTPANHNYKILRNALLTAVDMIRADLPASCEATSDFSSIVEHRKPSLPGLPTLSPTEAISCLQVFLGIRDSLEGDLATLQVLRQPGSCRWFTDQSTFVSWRTGAGPAVLWLVGRPAAGKSVLSSHVIDELRRPLHGSYCSYFIFKHAKTGESTLSDCFRSLAFQMAAQDRLVRDALLRLAHDDGLVWDKTDDGSVWRRLFIGCIFKLPPNALQQHFWVVDGVDECVRFNSLFTKKLLAAFPQGLKLFATSRRLEEIERGLAALGPGAAMQVLSEVDTLDDMRLFVDTRLSELGRPERPEDRESMCDKILKKSSGSFLWTRLVLQGFSTAWTSEAMDNVLNEIPADLFELYARMVRSIETDARKMALARPILTWVALASRPLAVEELRCAVRLDVNQTLQNAAKAVPDLCGQLVFVDQDGRVHLIHETAREFLLMAHTFGLKLAVDKKEGHTRLGSVLLQYLTGAVMKPSQQTKTHRGNGWNSRAFAKHPAAEPSPVDTSLLSYASNFFSEHVYRATSASDTLMGDLCAFFKARNVLSWIELIARSGDLIKVTQTAVNLREYHDRRLKYVPPTDPSIRLVDGWVTDLIRVAAKFCTQLLACPSSIHHLIPPLCPSDSIIFRTFVARNAGLRPASSATTLIVKGLPSGSWDDCLIRMDFEKGQATAISHGDHFFAIGLSTGRIWLYDAGSVQSIRKIEHPERVKILQFSPDDVYLASSGAKQLAIWEPKVGVMVHSFQLRSPPLAITFLGTQEVLCGFQSSEMTKWNMATTDEDSVSLRDIDLNNQDDYASPVSKGVVPTQPPSRAAFLTRDDGVLLAIGYRSHPVLVWDALELQLVGVCQVDENPNGVNDMVFNPNPEIPVLVVSSQHGDLCVFDYITMELQHRKLDAFASSLACSADGRSLIAGGNQGLIEVFEFERAHDGTSTTLTLIYRTQHPLDGLIRGISFSPDGRRFLDVHNQQGRVWAPAALVRKIDSELESELGSEAVDAPTFAQNSSAGMIDIMGDLKVTSPLVVSTDSDFILAGKSNGDVVLFSTVDAQQVGVLYGHGRGSSVASVTLCASQGLVASADDSGRVLVVHVGLLSKSGLGQHRVILDQRFGDVVTQVLLNLAADRVLVCGRYAERSWEITTEESLITDTGSKSSGTTDPEPNPLLRGSSMGPAFRSIFQHPTNSAWYVAVMADVARVYSWADTAELTSSEGIRLERELSVDELGGLTPSYHVGPRFVIEHFRASNSSSSHVSLWPATAFDPFQPSNPVRPSTEPTLNDIGPSMFKVLGVMGVSTVVFLNVDFWICSVELQTVAVATRPARHASIPPNGIDASERAPPSPLTTLSQKRPSVAATRVQRHFFALNEWRTGLGDIFGVLISTSSTGSRAMGGSGSGDAVAFSNKNGIVVIKGGLGFRESIATEISTGFNPRRYDSDSHSHTSDLT